MQKTPIRSRMHQMGVHQTNHKTSIGYRYFCHNYMQQQQPRAGVGTHTHTHTHTRHTLRCCRRRRRRCRRCCCRLPQHGNGCTGEGAGGGGGGGGEPDRKQRDTLHNEIPHTRVSPQTLPTEHKNRTQKTNYRRVFFKTRPMQRTRTLNANRKWEITRRMETFTVVTKIYVLSVRLMGM